MIAGFVDGRGRAYDAGFRTLRLSLTDGEGTLLTAAGEGVRFQSAATLSLEIAGPKPVPFLRAVGGELTATSARGVFIAASELPRTKPFTFFNVALPLHPSAIEHFFTVQGGREFVQFTKEDVESTAPVGGALDLVLRGPAPGKPGETARFRARVEPRSAGEQALTALR